MTSVAKAIRNNKGLLTTYWGAIAKQTAPLWKEQVSLALLTSNSAILAADRDDGNISPALPFSFLQSQMPCNQAARLLDAVLQPGTTLITDRIIFRENFLALLASSEKKTWWGAKSNAAPKLVKAVSYPSAARELGPGSLLETDSFWMLDLFATGMTYADKMNDPRSFYVLNTSIYEGWNVFNEEEGDYIARGKDAKQIVERYLEILKERYASVLWNIGRRRKYVNAITRVLGMPDALDAEDLMQSRAFLKWLDRLKQSADRKGTPLFPRKPNDSFDFAAFVYAEERALRDKYGIDGYIGPLREELQLNTTIAGMCSTAFNDTVMPYIWYTRPKLADISFNTTDAELRSALDTPNPAQREYLFEILQRLGQLEPGSGFEETSTDMLVDSFIMFRKKIDKELKGDGRTIPPNSYATMYPIAGGPY